MESLNHRKSGESLTTASAVIRSNAHKPPKTVTPTIFDLKKSLPRPLKRPQTAKTCDAHNFHAR